MRAIDRPCDLRHLLVWEGDRNGFSTASATLLDYKAIRRESIITEGESFNKNAVEVDGIRFDIIMPEIVFVLPIPKAKQVIIHLYT